MHVLVICSARATKALRFPEFFEETGNGRTLSTSRRRWRPYGLAESERYRAAVGVTFFQLCVLWPREVGRVAPQPQAEVDPEPSAAKRWYKLAAHKNWLFAAMFGSIVFSAAKEFALGGHMLSGANAGFHVIFGLGAIVAAITRQEWFHKLLAPAIVLLFFLYIALLFARL
jgi:hypothetical protein